jgi:hypothetical protein
MKRLFVVLALAVAACDGHDHTHDDPNDPRRGVCNDIYNHTDECLVNINCEGIADRNTYVDQCLTEGYTAQERDQFVAASCDSVNASACTSATTFYRDNCDCQAYIYCPQGQTCTDTGDGTGACFDSATGGPIDGASTCDATHHCQAGYACALTAQDQTSGACVQLCGL